MKIIKQKFIIDESGSMERQQEIVINGFNEQLITMKKEEKEKNIQYLVTLVKFNETVTVLYADKPLTDVFPLTKETYNPNGWTALYDAIGNSIDTAVRGETDVLITIMSDGVDNRSHSWKKSSVKTLIEIRQKENKWGFVYFGSNQDAWGEGSSLGVLNSLTYTTAATGNAINSMSACRSSYVSESLTGSYNVGNLTCNVNKEDLTS
ncbi:MAG TPA: hypothetical protein VIH61_03875 [Waddliaceae bacterium]